MGASRGEHARGAQGTVAATDGAAAVAIDWAGAEPTVPHQGQPACEVACGNGSW